MAQDWQLQQLVNQLTNFIAQPEWAGVSAQSFQVKDNRGRQNVQLFEAIERGLCLVKLPVIFHWADKLLGLESQYRQEEIVIQPEFIIQGA
jgi:hypothetical protein